jgi:PAS domain S-box-containing protein
MNFEPSSLVISVGGAVLLSRIVKLPILGVLPVAHETLVDSMSDAIFVLDEHNNIVDANPKAQDLLRSTLSQTLAASIEKTWPEWPTVERALNSRAETGSEVTLGVESDRRVYEVRSSAIGGLIGNASYQLVTLHDITERTLAEEALRESEDRLRRITDNMLDMVVETDLQGICKYASPSCKPIMGYDPKDLVGKSLFDYVHPEDLATVTATIQRAVSTGRLWTGGRFECRYRHADGHYAWLENLANIVYDEKGQITGGVIGARDITDRKRMQDEIKGYSNHLEQLVGERTTELATSERKYRLLVDSMADVVFTIDLEGNYTFCTPQAEKMTGYTTQQLLSMNMRELIAPDDLARVLRSLEARTRSSKELSPIRFDIIRANGTRLPIEVKTSLLLEGSKLVGLHGVARDITERKRIEEALRESEDRLRTIFDSVSAGIMIIDPKTHEIVDANPAAIEIVGAPRDKILGSVCHKFICPTEKGHCPVTDLGQTIDYRQERLLLRVDGKRAPILKSVHTTILNGQEYLLESFIDISERKRMEDALRESEARFRELADLLPQIVFETDEKGNLTFGNQAGFTATGYTQEDIDRGLNASRLFVPEERGRIQNRIIRILGGEKSSGSEYMVQRKDGSTFPVNIYVTATLREGKPVGLRGIAIDITDRKRMEEQLAKSERLAAIGSTTAMVGHDLRNPLQALVGLVYLVKQHYESIPLEYKKTGEFDVSKMLLGIEASTRYMNKIVSDLQNYGVSLQPELAKLGTEQLLKESLSVTAIPSRVKVSVNVDKGAETINADRDLVKRVFTNLIMNAVQAMPQGGELKITARRNGEEELISFQDTGIGISRETFPKLFEPLFTTKAQGQGLGLAVCKRVMEAHGGTITVESTIGKGSTFTAKLPVLRNFEEKPLSIQ